MISYKLKDLLKIYNGRTYSHLQVGEIPLYGSGGIMSYVNNFLYDGEAILLPRKGTLSNIMYTKGKIWTVDTMYFANVNEGVDPYYLYSYLSLLNLKHLDSGSALPSMTKTAYEDIEVKLPNYDSQQKITKVLFSLDSKIEINNRINIELKEMAKALYDYWFIQFDFPDTNGKPYKSSGGKMVWNVELKREIPEGWEVKNLFSEMDVQYGFPFDTSKFTDDTTQKPVIRIRDILENSISAYSTEDANEKYILNSGDLLIGMDGNFHLNFWDKNGAYLNQRSVRIRSRQNSEVSNFQALFQLTPYIKAREQNVSRTTVGHLSDKDLKRLFVINATKTNTFSPKKTFDIMLSKIISNRLQNQELASLRDWLLPMLMNGQIKIK
jgi:type I restriction enzyme S subunit